MRYVLVDDSIPYDGYTSGRRPLGGPEKAVASLAIALQARGHEVNVVNRTPYAHMADGAYYMPFGDGMAPKSADVLIAVRKPALLGAIRNVGHRLLWVVGATDYLSASANAPLWTSFTPTLLFVSEAQARTYNGPLKSLVMAPGALAAFYDRPAPGTVDIIEEVPDQPAEPQPSPTSTTTEPGVGENPVAPPHAVVTTHPLQGLGWLLDLWRERVYPRLPAARLAVYSALLSKGLKGEAVSDQMKPLLAQVAGMAAQNVVVIEPRNDYGMAEVYRTARVHLYPGHALDFACWTLAESQAAGLPAVARALGGAEERIANGQTGYIVPDAAAFANVAVEILSNDAVWRSLGEAAQDITRRRTWDHVAAELDATCSSLSSATREAQAP